ncbi:MAG: hypothetical protein ACI9F9_000339 [Candidatus Paceibacteria bacterium]|jgi:hypothetical protein
MTLSTTDLALLKSSLQVSAFLLGSGLMVACQAPGTPPAAVDVPMPTEASAMIAPASSPFQYLLNRYDTDGDETITQAEYTRHDGQLARWDTNADGMISGEDWSGDDSMVRPQITAMRRMDTLGRYFQTDEGGPMALTIDELANAFLEYDEAGSADELLSESEFLALADQRALKMPGDGSMMKQSYVGTSTSWNDMVRLYNMDGDDSLSMEELASVFEELDRYELRFDEVRFDDGGPGAQFEERAYIAGLEVGSSVPKVMLSDLKGGPSVDLALIAGDMPIALIFGSYT